MAESEIIKEGAISKTFEKLYQNKTLLTISLDNSDEEHLTRVTSLTTRHKTPHFTIDPPEGFAEAVADSDSLTIHFEYAGPDKIKYRFKTICSEIDGHQIFLQVPQEIERLQRRRLFRIDAPEGTRLCFTLRSKRYELRVINISLGGSLGMVVQTDRQGPAPPLTIAQALNDVELIFPQNLKRQPVKIKTMQLKRMKRNPETAHIEVAFEFNELSSRNETLLNDSIYHLQRQYLRKRLPLELGEMTKIEND